MAYYFMVEKKRGEFQPIDICKSKYYFNGRKYDKKCAYSLDEIDSFTMMFNNEEELRKVLVNEDLLDIELMNKPLSSRNYSKGQYNKVPYGFLYQRDMELIAEPKRVIDLILYKYYYKSEFVFIKRFADCFSNFYECRITAAEVRNLSADSIRIGMWNRHMDEVDKNGDILVKRLIKLLIYKHYEMDSGYIKYNDKINYRNLHMIIAFIRNYNKEEDKPVIKATNETIVQLTLEQDKSFSLENAPKVKTRTRKKKNINLEGQITFDDITYI